MQEQSVIEHHATSTSPVLASVWIKLIRAFIVAAAGGFLTALLPIADKIASGQSVSFNGWQALAVAAVVGGIAAGIRAVIAALPLFVDDNNFGIKKG